MEISDRIQAWRRRFLLVSALFTLLLCIMAILARYEQSVLAAAAHMAGLGNKLSAMRAATDSMKRTLTELRGIVPPGYGDKSATAQLFDRVDDLKKLFPKGSMTIAAPAEQAGGMSLPFSIRCDGSYAGFVNSLALAQTRRFPFVLVNRVAMEYDQSSTGGVAYKVDGTILAPTASVAGESR